MCPLAVAHAVRRGRDARLRFAVGIEEVVENRPGGFLNALQGGGKGLLRAVVELDVVDRGLGLEAGALRDDKATASASGLLDAAGPSFALVVGAGLGRLKGDCYRR